VQTNILPECGTPYQKGFAISSRWPCEHLLFLSFPRNRSFFDETSNWSCQKYFLRFKRILGFSFYEVSRCTRVRRNLHKGDSFFLFVEKLTTNYAKRKHVCLLFLFSLYTFLITTKGVGSRLTSLIKLRESVLEAPCTAHPLLNNTFVPRGTRQVPGNILVVQSPFNPNIFFEFARAFDAKPVLLLADWLNHLSPKYFLP